jgi:hypothetical protein
MSVRTTIDIPDGLYAELRAGAARERVSIRSLVIHSIEENIKPKRKLVRMTGPPIKGTAGAGPLPLDTENPYDLIFG